MTEFTYRNTGIVRVSIRLLEHLLHVPEGHRIVGVRQASDLSDTLDVRIEGPLLPSVNAHEVIPRVGLICTVTEDGTMVRERKIESKFE